MQLKWEARKSLKPQTFTYREGGRLRQEVANDRVTPVKIVISIACMMFRQHVRGTVLALR